MLGNRFNFNPSNIDIANLLNKGQDEDIIKQLIAKQKENEALRLSQSLQPNEENPTLNTEIKNALPEPSFNQLKQPEIATNEQPTSIVDYIKQLTTTAQPNNEQEFVKNIGEAGNQKDLLGMIGSGLGTTLKYLNTTGGKKILSGMMNPQAGSILAQQAATEEENNRKHAQELSDLGSKSILEYILNQQKLEPKQEAPLKLGAGEQAFKFNPKTGEYENIASIPSKPPIDVSWQESTYMKNGKKYRSYFNPKTLEVKKTDELVSEPPDNSDKEKRKNEVTLRKEFDALPEVKNFKTVKSSYNRIANTSDSAAGDLSLIFSYMKLLDPTSVVRESEYASARNAAGVPEKIANLYNKVKDGMQLTPEQRKDFRTQAKEILKSEAETYNSKLADFKKYAKDSGLNPDNIGTEYIIDNNINNNKQKLSVVVKDSKSNRVKLSDGRVISMDDAKRMGLKW